MNPNAMNILHLEDSENDAALVEALVRTEWPKCSIRNVVKRAEYHAALEVGGFDLIISDYAMPDFDGLSALGLARTWCPDKPFIFMSGTLGEERAVEALKLGATDYIIKDRPTRLISAIRQALALAEETGRRLRTEEALRQNRERYRQITENVADMIAVLDLTGRRVYFNPAYLELLGEERARPGSDAFGDVHPEDRDRIRALFADTVHTGAKHRLEYRLRLADTEHFIESQASVIRDASGNVSSVLVVARDITERRRNEEHLRELAALVEKAQDAIYVRDLDQHITYWNPGAERLYGWMAEEVLSKRAVELFYKEETPELQEVRRIVMEKGEWMGELRQLNKQGLLITVMARRNLLRDTQGRPVSILNINTDVTEQRQLETQLLRTQRMESIGTLTSRIAHDLNNVLSPILMGSELIAMTPINDSARNMIASIGTSARHGAALVRQLLSFARGIEGERSVVTPAVFLADMKLLLRQTLTDGIELRVACAPDCRPVLADPTQLRQVVLNLCINARDAMPGGGVIEIAVVNVVVDAVLARSLPEGAPGEHLCISISDTGTGMPPAVIEKIFDPFFTTKEEGKGTGLGLATVRGIMKGHGGFVQVESEVAQGTTFRLYLPVQRALSGQGEAGSNGAKASVVKAVLVIDDDAGVREALQMELEYQGYRVITACDGREGIERFRSGADRIAAVITDLAMPVVNGVEVIAAVREQAPHMPIIAMKCLNGGAVNALDFDSRTVTVTLEKPISAPVLLEALQQMIKA
jgi:PAS domain S-box-containing protein